MENNQTFQAGQRVVCNRFFEINKTLAYGLKEGGIYLIDEVIKCQCGNILLALNGVYDPEVSGRICVCGKDKFPINAFNSKRFEIVHLNIVR